MMADSQIEKVHELSSRFSSRCKQIQLLARETKLRSIFGSERIATI